MLSLDNAGRLKIRFMWGTNSVNNQRELAPVEELCQSILELCSKKVWARLTTNSGGLAGAVKWYSGGLIREPDTFSKVQELNFHDFVWGSNLLLLLSHSLKFGVSFWKSRCIAASILERGLAESSVTG